jgi:hypothetical protein
MVFVATLGALIPALGIGADRCAARAASEIHSLSGLPATLRAVLPPAAHGSEGIADTDAPFNATDVVDHTLPRRRFTLAAVSGDCAVIAIEFGGYTHGFEISEYHLARGGWKLTNNTSVFRRPKTVMDLLSAR